MAYRRIDGLGELRGKRALVRVDLNVPLKEGAVADDFRILAILPTLERLRSAGARVVLCSHLGRPKDQPEPEFSLAPVAARLSELCGAPVAFCPTTVGAEAEAAANALGEGEILLVENLRFQPGEKSNDPEFAAALAKLGDVFLAPLRAGTAPRPFVVVLGGAKLGTKIPVLKALLPRTDAICVGGGMAYTLLKAMGKPIGASRCEEDLLEVAGEILEASRLKMRETGQELVLPRDHVVAKRLDESLEGYDVVEDVPDDLMALDVGPSSVAEFIRVLRTAKTVFWNGPLGVFEQAPFHLGTEYVASYLAGRQGDCRTIVGGGDSAAATRQLGFSERMSWVSTGGGASLLFVQGEDLPGLSALPAAS